MLALGLHRCMPAFDKDLNEMTIFHTVEEPQAAAEVASDQRNVRRPVIFEEGSKGDEELIIHQERILFTSHEAVEPVTTLKNAKFKGFSCTAVRKFLFNLVIRICFAKLFPSSFSIRIRPSRGGKKN